MTRNMLRSSQKLSALCTAGVLATTAFSSQHRLIGAGAGFSPAALPPLPPTKVTVGPSFKVGGVITSTNQIKAYVRSTRDASSSTNTSVAAIQIDPATLGGWQKLTGIRATVIISSRTGQSVAATLPSDTITFGMYYDLASLADDVNNPQISQTVQLGTPGFQAIPNPAIVTAPGKIAYIINYTNLAMHIPARYYFGVSLRSTNNEMQLVTSDSVTNVSYSATQNSVGGYNSKQETDGSTNGLAVELTFEPILRVEDWYRIELTNSALSSHRRGQFIINAPSGLVPKMRSAIEGPSKDVVPGAPVVTPVVKPIWSTNNAFFTLGAPDPFKK